MTNEILVSTLQGMKQSIDATNDKIDKWLSGECPKKHLDIEHRMTNIEVRMYLIFAAITLIINGAFYAVSRYG